MADKNDALPARGRYQCGSAKGICYLVLRGVARAGIRFERGLKSALTLIAVCMAGCAPITPRMPPSTLPFMGPQVFNGTYLPRSSNAKTGGEATYSGYIVFTNLSRSLVDAVLPPDLQLATNSVNLDLHPVIFLFGHQRNTKWLIAGTPIPIGNDYKEMMVVIPFVQKQGGVNWHNYVLRMYLDDWAAISLGNLYFAYAKEWGTADEFGIAFTEFHYVTPYFSASMQEGTWQTSAQAELALPNYKAIQAIFEMPMVGWDSWLGLKCSYFEFHYGNAMVAALQSEHQFLRSFRANMGAWVALGSLSSVPDGAIAIEGLDWRINHPPAPTCRF
jgi:hypothetical protein